MCSFTENRVFYSLFSLGFLIGRRDTFALAVDEFTHGSASMLGEFMVLQTTLHSQELLFRRAGIGCERLEFLCVDGVLESTAQWEMQTIQLCIPLSFSSFL